MGRTQAPGRQQSRCRLPHAPTENSARHKMDRHVGRAAGRSAAGDRPGALCRRHQFPAPASHADRALQPCPRQHHLDRYRSRTRFARRRRGMDRGRHSRSAADRFSRRPDREARAVSPAGTGAATSALCRRSGRGRICGGSVPCRGRRRSRHHGDRGTAAAARRRDEPGEFSFGRDTEADVLHQGYGDVDAVFKSAPHIVELQADRRPPFRRAAGKPRRHRPLRRLA